MQATAQITALMTLAAALVTAPAAAQSAASSSEFSGYHPSSDFTTPSFAPTPPSSRIHHASTAHEGVGRAIASIMKAYTDGQVSLAQARILIAEARAREYQLRVVNTETYLVRKQMLEDARDAERLRKFESAQLAQARREQREETELYQAYRLPATVLNHATGQIAWPATLQACKFANLTADLQALFEQLASEGAQYDRLFRDPIVQLVQEFREDLEQSRETLGIDWQDYLACQKLLVGLKYEADQWPTKDAQDGRRLVAIR